MKEHPWMNRYCRLTPEGKRKLEEYIEQMNEAAMKVLRELPDEERELMWDFCDEYLQSGASGFKYTLQNFISGAFGLDFFK